MSQHPSPDPLILHLETSGHACSVALAENGEMLSFREQITSNYSHAEVLSGFIREVIEEAGKVYVDVNAVALGMGPGSYTGLRIGTATAKGLCFALDIPLIGMTTTDIMVQSYLESMPSDKWGTKTWLCPMLDARRMEVFAAVYDVGGNLVREVQAEVVDEDTYRPWLDKGPVIFFGDGAPKCREVLGGYHNTHIEEGHYPLARHMVKECLGLYRSASYLDLAYFEPLYAKEFQSKKARKLL